MKCETFHHLLSLNRESVHTTSNYPAGLPHSLIVTFFMRMLFKNNGCVSWHSLTYCITY